MTLNKHFHLNTLVYTESFKQELLRCIPGQTKTSKQKSVAYGQTFTLIMITQTTLKLKKSQAD